MPNLLVHQEDADPLPAEQLRPDQIAVDCKRAGTLLTLRTQPGDDHGHRFFSTFMVDHSRRHAERLR